MQFRSPTETPVRVASIAGGVVAIVGPSWREIPEVLHRLALELGCQCDQGIIENPTIAPAAPLANTPDDHLRACLIQMIERNEPGDFTGAGKPNINALAKLAGGSVDKVQAYTLFEQLSAEASELITDPAVAA